MQQLEVGFPRDAHCREKVARKQRLQRSRPLPVVLQAEVRALRPLCSLHCQSTGGDLELTLKLLCEGAG